MPEEDTDDGAVLQAVAVTVVEGESSFADDKGQESSQEEEEQLELSSTDSESEDEFGYTWKKLSKKYQHFDGELHLIELVKEGKGLGISLAGNRDRSKMSVFVVGVDANGAAGHDGRIQIADEILEINGNSVVGRSHQNASAIIKSISGNNIALVIHRHPNSFEHLAVKPITPPPPAMLDKEKSNSIEEIQAQAQAIIAELEPTVASSPESNHTPNLGDIGLVLPQQHSTDDFSKYPNVSTITLMKGNRGLGFAILESPDIFNRAGIFVKDITHGGPADQDGHLRIGDQILAVNDRSLVDVSKSNAIPVLKDTDGAVRLTVSSDHPNIEEPEFEEEDLLEAVDAPVSETSLIRQYQMTDLDAVSSDDEVDQAANQSEGVPADPFTCPIVPGREITIVIDKGNTGLGLSIVGGTDTELSAIVVHEVYEQGAASRDDRLQPGDQILSVNNFDLSTASHDEAIAILRQTPTEVRLVVFRDIYDIHTAELTRVQGKGLGLSIVGKRNDVGVFISDIVTGGIAEADGRLARGDQILSVSGEDVRDARQDRVAAILKASHGTIKLTVGRLKPDLMVSADVNESDIEHHATPAKATSPNPMMRQLQEDPMLAHVMQDLTPESSDNEPKLLDGIRIVNLHRSPGESLGFSIAGGRGSKIGDAPICVASISPGGMADKSRQLQKGDCILTINGQSVEGATHTTAAEMLKQSQGNIVLEVYREEAMDQLMRGQEVGVGGMVTTAATTAASAQDDSPDSDEPPVSPSGNLKEVELDRGPDGLGFSIVGGYGSPHGDLPIYIKTVFNRGAAAENGQLKRGDQIVAVNGEQLESVTHEEAVNILKRARGKVILLVVV